jgi:hypothetical protein
MQCRHEAVFNIMRPRPILDVHARGMYSLNTLVWKVFQFTDESAGWRLCCLLVSSLVYIM